MSEEARQRALSMRGIRGPVDPAARRRIEGVAEANAKVRERAEAQAAALHAAEMTRIRALGAWPDGLAAWEKELGKQMVAEGLKIAAAPDLAEIYRCQGSLRTLAHLQKVLDEAKRSIHTPPP